MAYLILVRGPLGVGKTSVAKSLAHTLYGKYLSVDSLLEKHNLDKVIGKSIPLKNFMKANRLIIPKIKEKISKGRTVVVDGNFYYKEQIEHIVKSVPAHAFVFTLKAPLGICIKRDAKRDKSYGKVATTAVFRLVSMFDYGIPIDTENKSIEQTVEDILSHLPKKIV